MSTTKKLREASLQESEDHIRSEISELFLLLKSGKLTLEEVDRIKGTLDELVVQLEGLQKKHCCT